MASIAIGLIVSLGAEPADRTRTFPPDSEVIKPAAICDRPAL